MEAKKPKGDKRQRTRQKLIEAAAAVINEKGFDRTSLEEVARRAGMTRGAFYNNFSDKEELFVSVAETLWRPIEPPFIPGAGFREQMGILGKAVAAAAVERRRIAVGAASFQLYALTHAEMQERISQTNAVIYKWAEAKLLEFIPAEDLPMPPGEFVRVLHAMTEGLLTLHFLTPGLITEKTIIAAFESLS